MIIHTLRFGTIWVIRLDPTKEKVGDSKSTYHIVIFKHKCKCGSKFVMELISGEQWHNTNDNNISQPTFLQFIILIFEARNSIPKVTDM
jgi:hypothetical protein